jgi:DNA-binding transcriptional MerR regulator
MDSRKIISIAQVCLHYEVETNFLRALEEHGLLAILEEDNEYFVIEDDLSHLERILRLQTDLQINLEGIAVVSELLNRMEEMQREIQVLKSKLG